MTRRPRGDDPEMWAHQRIQSGDLPLFSSEPSASIEAGMRALRDTASKHEQEIERLIPLARELAGKAPQGITVSDLRIYAVQRGLLSGEERGRALSYLGKVMEAAGLEPTGNYVRSSIVKSHGNLNQSWRLPRQSFTGGDAA